MFDSKPWPAVCQIWRVLTGRDFHGHPKFDVGMQLDGNLVGAHRLDRLLEV